MNQRLADAVLTYLRAVERSDWTAARALCDVGATAWHNDGKGDETVDEYFADLEQRIDSYDSVRYDIRRRLSGPGEVLQQHVVHVREKDGHRGEVHAAVYFGFDAADLITRIEAYANYIPIDD